MRRAGLVLAIALAIALQPFALVAAPASAAATPVATGAQPTTAFQRALQESIAARAASGLPVPTVEYSTQQEPATPGVRVAAGGTDLPAKARTVIKYDNPAQAGYKTWPALVVKDGLPPEMVGDLKTGDYTQAYKDHLAKLKPGIWSEYQFGNEPRTRVVEESYETVPATMPETQSPAVSSAAASTATVLGFTYGGPQVRYIYQDSFRTWWGYEWASYRVGLELDWAAGLRLPLQTDFSAPGQVNLGEPYQLTGAVSPLDWTADDYARAGIRSEGGNEFVLRAYFFFGLRLIFLGNNLCPSCYVEVDADQSSSFATPIGSGARFPLPTRTNYFSPINVGIFSFQPGLTVSPDLTSTRITADWRAAPGSDCRGSGTATFSEPGAPVAIGPAVACDLGPTDSATVEITNLRYWFNQFNIRLIGLMKVSLFGREALNAQAELASVDLGGVTGGLWVGSHVQCTWDFNCGRVGPGDTVSVSSVAVDKAAPTTTATLSGAAGSNGWYRSDVQVALQSLDNPVDCGVGVRSTQYRIGSGAWLGYTAPIVLTKEGATEVSFRATDNAGNVAAAQTVSVKIDKTAPVITGAATRKPNAGGWYNRDVPVHFTASDALSGLASVTPDQVVSTEGVQQHVKGMAIDNAGNQAYAKVRGINLDKTAPTIVISSPVRGVYANTAAPDARWTVADGLSGIAGQKASLGGATVRNGKPIDLLLVAPGHQQFLVKATDKADNKAKAVVDLRVSTNARGLYAAVRQMCDIGWISSPATCRTLKHEAYVAIHAISTGDFGAAKNALKEFRQTVDAKQGTSIQANAARVLRADACAVEAALK